MSSSEAKKHAKQFLKDQAAIISKYGEAPKLSGQSYKTALLDTTRTFQTLSTVTTAKTADEE
jgi:hypothetical protein